MQPNPRFKQPKIAGVDAMRFWADIKGISQAVGYTSGKGATIAIKVPTAQEIVGAYAKLGLNPTHMFTVPVLGAPVPTAYGTEVLAYFDYRSKELARISTMLMDAPAAEAEFLKLRATRPTWTCPMPMNKQTGAKARYNYLTCMVNMIIEMHLPPNLAIDYDPRNLTAVTRGRQPLMTLSRRVDGAFPRTVNPSAIWEIKEYYHTTTFGSRVSGGVYETLLDGYEIQAMELVDKVHIHHYLIVDSHFTWWKMGRSYLTRMVDMLNMGLVDEVLFGREVLTELPRLVQSWPGIHATNVALHPADILPA